MNELELHQQTALAISDQQATWTEPQRAALSHIGVENASPGDLDVFFHVVKRTGLDPFARQIYMIGRQSSERDASGNWVKVTKQTIQTGIDGFRLIGRRAADARGQSISVAAPQWCHPDGSWRDAWMNAWGTPVAARITITRDGQPFTAVALFDEYKQTKRDGGLTQMWGQRPAGQIAKCAEALAWRMAFPQDLSGIYGDDEMHQADARNTRVSGPEPADPEPVQGEVMVTRAQVTKIAAAMSELGITNRDMALQFVNDVIAPAEVASRNDLTREQASAVIEALEAEIRAGAEQGADQ